MVRLMTTMTLLALAGSAMAEGPRYTYVEGRYQRVDVDSFADVDGDGFGIGGQVEIGDMWQAFASYDSTGLDFGIDLDEFALGGGFHGQMSATTDFVLNLAYLRADASTGFGSADEDGFGLSIGVRSMVRPQLELAGFVSYVDYDDEEYVFSGQAWYNLTQEFAIGANIGLSDDINRFGIGARYYFGL